MRELTMSEQDQVAGGGGVGVGDVAGGNSAGNGNRVDVGGNSLDLSNNASGNDVTITVDTNNRTVDRVVQRVETYLDGIVGGLV